MKQAVLILCWMAAPLAASPITTVFGVGGTAPFDYTANVGPTTGNVAPGITLNIDPVGSRHFVGPVTSPGYVPSVWGTTDGFGVFDTGSLAPGNEVSSVQNLRQFIALSSFEFWQGLELTFSQPVVLTGAVFGDVEEDFRRAGFFGPLRSVGNDFAIVTNDSAGGDLYFGELPSVGMSTVAFSSNNVGTTFTFRTVETRDFDDDDWYLRSVTFNPNVASATTPEPGTVALMCLGLLAAGFGRRLRTKSAASTRAGLATVPCPEGYGSCGESTRAPQANRTCRPSAPELAAVRLLKQSKLVARTASADRAVPRASASGRKASGGRHA